MTFYISVSPDLESESPVAKSWVNLQSCLPLDKRIIISFYNVFLNFSLNLHLEAFANCWVERNGSTQSSSFILTCLGFECFLWRPCYLPANYSTQYPYYLSFRSLHKQLTSVSIQFVKLIIISHYMFTCYLSFCLIYSSPFSKVMH